MIRLLVNPTVFLIGTVATVVFAVTFMAQLNVKLKRPVAWIVVAVLILAIDALQVVHVYSGGYCPGGFVHPDCRGGLFFKAKG